MGYGMTLSASEDAAAVGHAGIGERDRPLRRHHIAFPFGLVIAVFAKDRPPAFLPHRFVRGRTRLEAGLSLRNAWGENPFCGRCEEYKGEGQHDRFHDKSLSAPRQFSR